VFAKNRVATATCAAVLGVSAMAQAADSAARDAGDERRTDRAEVGVLQRAAEGLERSIDIHQAERRYDELLADAREAGIAPKRDLVSGVATIDELRDAIDDLDQRLEDAGVISGAGSVGTPESVGVSSATLEAIASCESGGDPTAVSADGTYRGKYQFDYGTWASVGGSGDPAAAPEAEQDYRAALLYAQSGSSPWPVCGV
jgi:soluble lytic murein transglycosylase-like protein